VLSQTVYQKADQRVGMFVDVQNMFYSAKSLHQSKLDYSKLLEEVVQDRKLVRAIAYVVQKPDVDQSSFLEALRRSGYEVKKKDLVVRDDGTTKGDWNLGIALDVVSLTSKLDTIVLVTGDGDFVPLAHMVKAHGCRVEVVSFEQCTSNELMRACDQFITIEENVLFKEEKFVRQKEQKAESYGPADAPEPFEQGYPHPFDPDR
jgi:uncharacterized LabA/DUF88 family protein